MEKQIKTTLRNVIGKEPISILEITNFGSVNNVFDVKYEHKSYIVRLNSDKGKGLEFLKEEWCINQVKELGVLSPRILHNKIHEGYPFMIQEKIEGLNGSICNREEKLTIWKSLGEYALKYSKIEKIDIPELIASEFHKNWKSKLEYNIEQLNAEDSLLLNGFTLNQHNKIRKILISLRARKYTIGLTHGDLSPRNVILNNTSTYLLDWGTAEINVVPFSEIGIVLMEGEANEVEFQFFLEGMGIDKAKYVEIESEIWKLNLLHRLDKYRWASSYDIENLKDYSDKISQVYKKIEELE